MMKCGSIRWLTALLGCIGFMIVYGLKVNLSVAIIAMVNHTAVASSGHLSDDEDANDTNTLSVDQCDTQSGKEGNSLQDGSFVWDEKVQGIILAAYFYGYIITQIPGGWVAEKFSAKHVFGVGTALNIVCAILTPMFAKMSYIYLIVLRIIMGIGGGVTLPAMNVLISKWAIPEERSRFSSTVYAGMTLGTLVCMPLSGILVSKLGWESVFYLQGGLSVIWYFLWIFLVYDSPQIHPMITEEEQTMLRESLEEKSDSSRSKKKLELPLKKVLTSMPVWAIIVAHTCGNWGWYMLLVKLPTYMRYILHFDIEANAGLSSIPFLCMWIFTMVFANVLDLLRGKGIISTTVARKLATTTASLPPAILLILVTYVGCNTILAVVFLTLGTTFMGGMYSGYLSNHIDIAPPFAGTLMGISNTFATIPGIVVPSFVGYMTYGNQTVEAWRTIFFITLGIFSFEAVFYVLFASGEQQSWSKCSSESEYKLDHAPSSKKDASEEELLKNTRT